MADYTPDFTIREDDLRGAEIATLLQFHLTELQGLTPPESVHALPIERLRAADVTFFSAWHGEALAACGAIKDLGNGASELKSMRADPAWRGRGAGRAILDHLLAVARRRGLTRLWLETGSSADFAPAHRLYLANGFSECGPFGDYQPDPFSVFMTRDL